MSNKKITVTQTGFQVDEDPKQKAAKDQAKNGKDAAARTEAKVDLIMQALGINLE